MRIVQTEIDSIHGCDSGQRMVFYRCKDESGIWHDYGPVMTIDPDFDAETYKSVVSAKVESWIGSESAAEM